MAGLGGIVAKKSISDLQKEQGRRTRVDSESDVEHKYKLGKVLGKGSFGIVLESKQLSTGQDFAIKVIQKERGPQMELIEREVSILQSMDHPHMIHLEEVFETPKKIYIVLELCLGGELSNVIKRDGPFKEEDARIIMGRLADALAYMHIKGMVHRDLKLENILVTGDDPLNVKITDFGLAYKMQKGLPGEDGHTLDGTCGTLLYMAPEVLENKLAYSDHCDVWSLGVIMYQIMCGRYPFYDTSSSKLEELIKSGKLSYSEPEWKSISDKAKSLISRMLHVDTTRRLRAGEVLNDPWIMGVSTQSDFKDIFELMKEVTEPAPNGLDVVKEELGEDSKEAKSKDTKVKQDKQPQGKPKSSDNQKLSVQKPVKKMIRSATVSSMSYSVSTTRPPRRGSDASARLKPSSSYSSMKCCSDKK